ncbi:MULTISPECIES: hypothetical protein [unclassified Iodidimonas]|jgi:hypothetical protein|nr:MULTISPECIES: hypothetical protein [unclassified Iodidimonas]
MRTEQNQPSDAPISLTDRFLNAAAVILAALCGLAINSLMI